MDEPLVAPLGVPTRPVEPTAEVAPVRGEGASPPSVPDHELCQRIGAGAYGEVWLARNLATGALRAVKIVYRSTFSEERPFNREFEGIKKFDTVSRSHPSQLALFHVGRNDAAGFFYYVMELADDCSEFRLQAVQCAVDLGLQTYSAHTLRADLEDGPLAAARVLEIALALTEALAHLHVNDLVHRDVKPSNIIFIDGRPKLADIGLVTDASDSRSIVGTEGYLAPEGPGTPGADIFALGKVLYEALTGMDRRQFPELPRELSQRADAPLIFELNEILLRACATNPRDRYASTEEMSADLALLQIGKSVKRQRACQRTLSHAKKLVLMIGTIAVASAMLHSLVVWRSRPRTIKWSKREEANKEFEDGNRALDQNTPVWTARAATNFERAIALDPGFARAQARLALAYISMGFRDPELLAKARPFAEKALSLDPYLDDAHRAIAVIRSLLLRDWTGAEKEYKEAIKLNGESAENFAEYAYFLSNRGRTNQAVQQMALALRKDSRSYRTLQGAAFVFQAARQPDEVINKIQEVIERESSPSGKAGLITRFLVPAYLAKGDYRMAIKLEEDSELLKGKKPDEVKAKYDALRKFYDEDKEKGYWQQQLRFELSENSENRPVRLAAIYARLGDTERAIDYLQQALVRTPTELVFEMNRDPSFDNVRSDAGFKEMLKKLEQGK